MVVRDRGAHDHDVAHHRGWRRHLVLSRILGRVEQVAGQVHRALRSEIGAHVAPGAVERDEPCVHGRDEDPPAARCARGARLVDPRRDAAVREVAVVAVQVHPRVVPPALRAARGVERDDGPERRRQVQRALHRERCRLEARAVLQQVAGAIHPGEAQVADVGARDPSERRVAAAARVAAVGGPVAGSPLLRRGARRVNQRREARERRDGLHAGSGDYERRGSSSSSARCRRSSAAAASAAASAWSTPGATSWLRS